MIVFGASDMTKAYVGSTEGSKAYLGDELVWGGNEDIYTFLSECGCIAWFPLAYEGDYDDVIGGLALTNVAASRMTWDTDRGMYLVNCVAQRPAATINLAASAFTSGGAYGVMAQVELKDGYSDAATVLWNNAAAGNGGLSFSESLTWAGTFVRLSGYARWVYNDNDVIVDGSSVTFTTSFTGVGLGRNKRYAASGNAYVRDLLFFNKLVPLTTFQAIKTRIESERQSI